MTLASLYRCVHLVGTSRFDRLHIKEGGKIGHVAVPVVVAKQCNVPRLVHVPVVLQLGGFWAAANTRSARNLVVRPFRS